MANVCEASCAWGFASDVQLVVRDPHNIVVGDFDLTSGEAEALATELLDAAAQARELERVCAEHDKED